MTIALIESRPKNQSTMTVREMFTPAFAPLCGINLTSAQQRDRGLCQNLQRLGGLADDNPIGFHRTGRVLGGLIHMKLSGELFQEIISQLTSDNAAGQHNKRQEPRVGVRAQGTVAPWTLDDRSGKVTVVTIRDLSPAGICILSGVTMQRGARFVLQLQRAQRLSLQAVYEVRYSKTLTSCLFAIGGKLVNLSDGSAKSDAA